MKRCLLLFLSCSLAAMCASVQAPVAGAIRYASGSVYPLLGMSRAFVPGQAIADHVAAAAFGEKAGILAVDGGLEIVDYSGQRLSRFDGDSSQAVLAMQATPSWAIAWLPASNTIVTFTGGTWRTTALTTPLPGTVVSARVVSQDTAHLLLREGAQIFEDTVGLASGNVLLQRLLPDVKAPAAYLADGLVYQDGDSLVFATAGAKTTVRFATPVAGFEQMSAQALHATDGTSGTQWAIALTRANGLLVSEIPVAAVTVAGGAR